MKFVYHLGQPKGPKKDNFETRPAPPGCLAVSACLPAWLLYGMPALAWSPHRLEPYFPMLAENPDLHLIQS